MKDTEWMDLLFDCFLFWLFSVDWWIGWWFHCYRYSLIARLIVFLIGLLIVDWFYGLWLSWWMVMGSDGWLIDCICWLQSLPPRSLWCSSVYVGDGRIWRTDLHDAPNEGHLSNTTSQSLYVSVCLYLCLSLSVCLCVCFLSLFGSIDLHVPVCICLSLSLTVCYSACGSLCLFLSFVCFFVSLFLCVSKTNPVMFRKWLKSVVMENWWRRWRESGIWRGISGRGGKWGEVRMWQRIKRGWTMIDRRQWGQGAGGVLNFS